MSPYNRRNREPGYDPRKIFDYWFCRGVQSAIFHYASCTDWKNYKAAKERKKQAERRAKERAVEQAIVTEQPRSIPQMQPLPSETNQGWNAEIRMGRKYDPRQTVDRRVSSGNPRSRANTADSDRYDYYRAKNPEIDIQSAPVVCRLPPPERSHEVAWMKSPPASRAVMEGKEVPAENAPPRWPLCIIEQTGDEYHASLRKMQPTPEDFRARTQLSKKEKNPLRENQLQWDNTQLDAKISHPPKSREAHTKSSRLPAEQDLESESGTHDSWLEPSARYNTSEHTSIRSGRPLSFHEDSMSVTNQDTHRHKHTSSNASWISAWESEPDTLNFSSTRNSRFFMHGSRRVKGKPRISSLVLVHKGDKSEIRGASYTYESFWNEQTRSQSVPPTNLNT